MGKTKILKVAGATLGFLMLLRTPVSALEINQTRIMDNNESPTSIIIERAVDNVSYAVSNTFRYTISAAETNPAEVANFPDSAEIVFNAVSPDEDNRATMSLLVDFSMATFSKVGDYEFLIRENGTNSTTRYPLDRRYYRIHVTVRNAVDENSEPTGDLVATLSNYVTKDDENYKSDRAYFWSEATNSYLELSNTVKGNASDPNKYFKYKIDLSAFPSAAEHYRIVGQDEVVNYGGEQITTSSEVIGKNEENYIYLKHGQTVRIGESIGGLLQVPIGYNYTVTLMPEDDYESTLDGLENLTTEPKLTLAVPSANARPTTKERFAAANTTHGVNTKNMQMNAVMTGVANKVMPYVAILVFGGLICFGVSRVSGHRKE